jgi:hypothetical protein
MAASPFSIIAEPDCHFTNPDWKNQTETDWGIRPSARFRFQLHPFPMVKHR